LQNADILLTQLLPSATPIIDSELAFQIFLCKTDYLQRLGSFPEALDAIESLTETLESEDADIYQRTHVMVLKAMLFSRVGKPQKGFSVAMRAANAAWGAKLLPALWEAWGAVANILGAMEEFEAEKEILDAIIPQVSVAISLFYRRTS
jgi:anaphase-promoting complex subunit 5